MFPQSFKPGKPIRAFIYLFFFIFIFILKAKIGARDLAQW